MCDYCILSFRDPFGECDEDEYEEFDTGNLLPWQIDIQLEFVEVNEDDE